MYVSTSSCDGPRLDSTERRITFHYSFTVRDAPEEAESVVAWVPLPLGNRKQTLIGYSVAGDRNYSLVIDETYGNRFLRFDLTHEAGEEVAEIPVSVAFDIDRSPYRIGGDGDGCAGR